MHYSAHKWIAGSYCISEGISVDLVQILIIYFPLLYQNNLYSLLLVPLHQHSHASPSGSFWSGTVSSWTSHLMFPTTLPTAAGFWFQSKTVCHSLTYISLLVPKSTESLYVQSVPEVFGQWQGFRISAFMHHHKGSKIKLMNYFKKKEITGELSNIKRPWKPQKTTRADDCRTLRLVGKNIITRSQERSGENEKTWPSPDPQSRDTFKNVNTVNKQGLWQGAIIHILGLHIIVFVKISIM